MMSTPQPLPSSYPAERLTAFTDAVMAVAITLLVLDLKLPHGLAEDALGTGLFAISRDLWCFALSFVVIGLLWMAHHQQFTFIKRVDPPMMWLNLLFLMGVCLIPFTTSVLSDNGGPLATVLYAGVLLVVSLSLAVMFAWASRRPELMPADVATGVRRTGVITPLLVAAVFALSIGVALLFGAAAGQWTWLLAAVAGPVADRIARA